MPAPIALIAAVAENGVIGRKNALPWRLQSDMRYFQELTMGQPIIMGRKTWESIFEKHGAPLRGRQNIVLSRQNTLPLCESVQHASEPQSAYDHAVKHLRGQAAGAKIWVIGGAAIYESFMERASFLYVTEVHARPQGDAFFPHFDKKDFLQKAREKHEKSEKDEFPFSFVVWERRGAHQEKI